MLSYSLANGTRWFICNLILNMYFPFPHKPTNKCCRKRWYYYVMTIKFKWRVIYALYCLSLNSVTGCILYLLYRFCFKLSLNEYWLSNNRLSHQNIRSCWLMGHRICYLCSCSFSELAISFTICCYIFFYTDKLEILNLKPGLHVSSLQKCQFNVKNTLGYVWKNVLCMITVYHCLTIPE